MSTGEKLVTGGDDCALRIYDVASGECLHVLTGQEAPVMCVLQLDEDTLVFASIDQTIRAWRISDEYLR